MPKLYRHLPSFQESGICLCTGQGCLCDQPPGKTPGHRVSQELPLLAAFHTCCQNLPLSSIFSTAPLVRDTWAVVPAFSWAAPCAFSFCQYTWYPSAVTSRSHECSCMLTLVSPLSELPDLKEVLGTSQCNR